MKLSGELPLTKRDTDLRPGQAVRLNPEMNWLAFSLMLQEDIDRRAAEIKGAQEKGEVEKAVIFLTAQEVLLGLQRAIVAGLHAGMGEKPDE